MMKALSLGGSLLWGCGGGEHLPWKASLSPPAPQSCCLPWPHVSMAMPWGVVGTLCCCMCACISGKLFLM